MSPVHVRVWVTWFIDWFLGGRCHLGPKTGAQSKRPMSAPKPLDARLCIIHTGAVGPDAFMLSPWPVEQPADWTARVNAPLTTKLAEGMQDVGYLNTTTAICEHVDNSLAANASEVRVYFRKHRTTWSRSAHRRKDRSPGVRQWLKR